MPTDKTNKIGEVTVYSKRKYADELKKQQEKYLADMAKYKKDSAQWVKANQAYQDSLKLYNLETNTRDFIEKHWDWIKYGNTLSIEEVENISRDANKNNYRTPLIHHGGYEATFYDKDIKTSDHIYKKGDIHSTKDNKQEDFYTFINSTKISPIGFKPILNHGESYDKNRSYDFSPVYAKPKGTKFPTKPNSPIPIKYDPKYENLKMRSLWANKAKVDTTANIGVLNPLEYNDESKGFTIREAMKFPKEIKDKYNIDMIGNKVGIKRNGGTIKYSKPPKHMLGAIIGAANTAFGIYNSIKANKAAKEANQLAINQRNSMLQTEDSFILDKYPVNGNQMTGFYKKGGKISSKELRNGSKEEMEHTSSKKVARRIAKDHLEENPKYYSKLKKAGLAEEYPNGGNIKLVGYNAKGGDLLPMSSNMNKVKGNTHEERTIDNTNGVKLANATGQTVAEVEDEEVIKDNKKVYSDRLELKKGVTYAKEAERVAKKIADAEKVLSDPNVNFRKKNAAKIQRDNWNRAAEDLFNHQEMMKQKKGIKDDTTNVPKGADGLDLSKLVKGAMPYVDNVANAVLTAFTPKPAFPMLARQRKLKTDFNINPQLQDVTDTVNQTTQGIDRGTSSSNVARQNTTAIKLAGMKAKGQLYSQKENVETQLQNQDTLNKQQVEGQNLARIEGFNDSMQQRAYNIQGRTAANVANAVEDFNKKEQVDAYGKYQDEQLRTIRETYNTGGTGLRVDLNNPMQIDYLKSNPIFKDNAAKDYLQKNPDGTYKYPREAQRFLETFPEYK